MASTQKRLLTAPNSKLTKQNLVAILRKDDAWLQLPPETRQHLYTMLPAPREGEPAHDADVHPLHTAYKPYIEEALRRFGTDLKDGREVKKWRLEAMVAERERREGKFDEWREALREEYWGSRGEEDAKGEGEVNGCGEHGDGDGAKVKVKDGEGDD